MKSVNYWGLYQFILYMNAATSGVETKAKPNVQWFGWAAAAAKSLQSCLTLCDPIDGSPPGSPVPGILQARTLEWVAIPSPMRESEKGKWSRSVESDPQRPHGLQPSRLLHPWDFPGRSTGPPLAGLEQVNSFAKQRKLAKPSLWLKCNCISRFGQGFTLHQALKKTFISNPSNLNVEASR